jgi:ligand-binding SRPBCC domain-containing protein
MFIDEQLKGPYKKWVHTHSFIPLAGGTLIKDSVIYKIPFGALGSLVAGYFIKKDISQIFNYRRSIINKVFP